MEIEIRRLTPELVEDYVRFFDVTPHDQHVEEHKCYCVCWCNDDYEEKDFSTAQKRREIAKQYVTGNHIQGYLAYLGDTVVGWCNANTKMDCLKCVSWRYFMDYVSLEKANSGTKVKSIFCFVIAPEMKRQGIASKLLDRVCEDALLDGFDIVEAYPYIESSHLSSDFGGYAEMYEKHGFHISTETEKGLVMRKILKP